MLEALLELPSHLQSRLVMALETGRLASPYPIARLRTVLSGEDRHVDAVLAALHALDGRGVDGRAAAFALELARDASNRVDRPVLVWSGPGDHRLHARETRVVYEELLNEARETIWISTYALYDGARLFATLADRMDRAADLRVVLLLNIGRKIGNTTKADDLVAKFADNLWNHEWPGIRRPDVFYDPRSLELPYPEGVLHAKAVVVDDRAAFIGSANLTEAAFERNYEAGVLSRDRALAASLARHFRTLIDLEKVKPLPTPGP